MVTSEQLRNIKNTVPTYLKDIHILRETMNGVVVASDGSVYEIERDEIGIWDNVSDHCAIGMMITDVLAEAMNAPDTVRREINAAFWLHDSGKKTERMWQIAIEGHIRDDKGRFMRRADKSEAKKRALAQVGSMEEWENAEAGIPPSVSQLMKANIPPSISGNKTLAEKIVWFADACLTGTEIKPVRQRFDDLENDSKNGVRNRAFSTSFIPQYGISLYDLQRQLGDRYSYEFAAQIGITPEKLYAWLEQRIEERVNLQQMPILSAVRK
ncbi:hypothetical protein C4579_01255 [Candidatus Microgenomates bacterium]|nr:MAG: hypothetical protein C4579_01255 [Candidatus Microgenomates bacterium]